jgi:hypothetical protein
VIHAARVAAGEAIDRHAIDDDSMRRGITLAEWFSHEWLRVRGVGEIPLSPDATTALEKINEAGGTIADRELRTCSRRLKDAKTRGEAIAELVAAGLVTTVVDDTTGGRPAVSITLVQRHEPGARSHKFEKPDEYELTGTGNASPVETNAGDPSVADEQSDHQADAPAPRRATVGSSKFGRVL